MYFTQTMDLLIMIKWCSIMLNEFTSIKMLYLIPLNTLHKSHLCCIDSVVH